MTDIYPLPRWAVKNQCVFATKLKGAELPASWQNISIVHNPTGLWRSHKLTVPAINLYFNHVQCGCLHSSMHCLRRVTFPFFLIEVLLHRSVTLKHAWEVVWRCRLQFCCRPDGRWSNQAGGWSCGGPPGCRSGSRPGVLGLHEEIQVRN